MPTLHELDLQATARDTGTGWEHTLLLDGEPIDSCRSVTHYRVAVVAVRAGAPIARSWHRTEAAAARARSQHGGGRSIPVEVIQ